VRIWLQYIGGAESAAKTAAEKQIKDFAFNIDSASLVFAHTILDTVAHNCCVVAAHANPQTWEDRVLNRKMPLKEVKGKSFEELRKRKLAKFLDQLERASLLEKADLLHSCCLCGTDAPRSKSGRCIFDRRRIEKLDKLRHDIVHGRKVQNALPEGDEEINYMFRTGLYLCVVVCRGTGIRLDPRLLQDAMCKLSGMKS
jgi:hypothetical protein